jgi:hypothetical protein
LSCRGVHYVESETNRIFFRELSEGKASERASQHKEDLFKMVKELTVTLLSLLLFLFLVFAGEIRGIFVGVKAVPQKKQVSSCPQIEKSRHGWEEDR